MRKFSIEQMQNLNQDFEKIVDKTLTCMDPICGIFNVKPLVASIRFCMEFANRIFTIVEMIAECQLYGERQIEEGNDYLFVWHH